MVKSSKYKEVKVERPTRNGYELILYNNGDKEYRYNGNLHREDGSAREYVNGDKEWWLNGNELTKEWFLQNPEKIVPMKAWDLFEPEELIRLKLAGKP